MVLRRDDDAFVLEEAGDIEIHVISLENRNDKVDTATPKVLQRLRPATVPQFHARTR
jgi:hypothetical protein